jgi:hypothetical protein
VTESWARGHLSGHIGQAGPRATSTKSTGSKTQLDFSPWRQWPPVLKPGRRYGAESRGRRTREGAGTHPAYASMLGGDRRRWKAANRGGGARADFRENGDNGVDSWHSGLIPSAKIKRTARQSSGHAIGGRGGLEHRRWSATVEVLGLQGSTERARERGGGEDRERVGG